MFYDKSDEEIFEFLSGDFITYMVAFLGGMVFVGFLSMLTRTLAYFDLAKWIDPSRMNVGRIIINDAEDKNQQILRDFLLDGLLIKDRPGVKKVHIAKLICTAIVFALLVSSLALFLHGLVTGIYEGIEIRGESEETVLKGIFLGGSAMLLYFTILFMVVHTVVQNNILKKKRREYLFEVHSSNRYPV